MFALLIRVKGYPATYQGALSSSLRLLEADMIAAGPALRSRSKYRVIFVSDGAPEPRCRLGCEDDQTRCSMALIMMVTGY